MTDLQPTVVGSDGRPLRPADLCAPCDPRTPSHPQVTPGPRLTPGGPLEPVSPPCSSQSPGRSRRHPPPSATPRWPWSPTGDTERGEERRRREEERARPYRAYSSLGVCVPLHGFERGGGTGGGERSREQRPTKPIVPRVLTRERERERELCPWQSASCWRSLRAGPLIKSLFSGRYELV